ncbi:NADH-quinone oxidoreductase subunit NuoF [bacterium]|nr:NADH-quinone oxidoreductase subunit NuoF [bacterium]
MDVIAAFEAEIERHGLHTAVEERPCSCGILKVGCKGLCARDVLVDIMQGDHIVTYQYVKPAMVPTIIEQHILGGEPVEKWRTDDDYDHFHRRQEKILLKQCGVVDPENIGTYFEVGGYKGAREALLQHTPEEVIDIVTRSQLRGRGGAGFPAGVKWAATRRARGNLKYLICNADEGDPGAFMDRALLEGSPHSVIEGMVIAGYAIGAVQGYIYVRAEYPLAVKRLRHAFAEAYEHGLLGKNIFGSGADFDLEIRLGAGAFVCGEATALISSCEDRIGTPRVKPPRTAASGLWGRPTNINNVETFANVPIIIRRGAEWYRSIGTEASPGTKLFSLVGKVKNTGLIEVPMGMTLREIVEEIGGGVPDGKTLKAVQTGGPSGGCIPLELMDTPVDFEHLQALGSIMGSGGMVVMDEDSCMVDVARYFLEFCRDESCGQCTPCRDGTRVMVRLLEDICAGRGTPEHLERLEALGKAMEAGSLCGLGESAPNPVLSTLRYFRDEYEAHIYEKRCPAKVCKELITFCIDEEKCTGCVVCKRACPHEAISGEKKQLHVIDQDACVRCGICLDVCRFDAVYKE